MSPAGNSGRLHCSITLPYHYSVTLPYQCVRYFYVSKQWYGCQCLGLTICTQVLMHAIAHGGFTYTVRGSVLKAGSAKKQNLVLCTVMGCMLHFVEIAHKRVRYYYVMIRPTGF